MAERTRDELRQERRQRIDERAQLDQERQRRRQRQALLRVGVPLGILVLVLAGVLAYAVKEATKPLPGEAMALEGSSHVEVGTPIQYQNYPPTSGTHFGSTARWGYSDAVIQPGFWVHNLEHGGIVILYKCPADCTQLKQQLRQLHASLPRSPSLNVVKAIIAPDDKIDTTLVALAWGRKLALDGFDESQLRYFYQSFLEAKTAPEPLAG